jgi:transcriptional regulator NrdR family protein
MSDNPAVLQCPVCGSFESNVTDSRGRVGAIRRRRRCLDCDTRYTTFETVRDHTFGRKELTALVSELETLLAMANKVLASSAR